MAILAIKGHATRGREVIELLKMLGGKNVVNFDGSYEKCFYSIDNTFISSTYGRPNLQCYTLEEFIEKFPYKVGDKVKLEYYPCTIQSMEWDSFKKEILYTVKGVDFCTCVYAAELQPYKEENMEEKLEQIILEIPTGYEFFGINDDNKVVLTKKQLKHPQTYEECCETLNVINTEIPYIILSQLGKPINSLAKLIVCRDAYWKIAGEEMGLGKPWEPDFNNENEYKYGLFRLRNIIYKDATCINPTLLIFPTEEMRNAFYENFKELIDACKELL